MRILGRLLLLLLFVGVAGLLYEPVRSLLHLPPPAPEVARQLDLTARSSTVYFMAEEKWLTFPVISQAARLRILTHAGAASGTEPGVPLRYAMDYEILDNNQNPLDSGRYIHETRIPEPSVKDGVPVARNLYTDRDLAVTAGQSFNIQLDALPQTGYIRLRLRPLTSPLKNVAVRVYYEERMSEKKASVAWERLGRARQTRLADGVIYPPELLTRQERLNLLERQWQPVGPIGARPDQGVLYSLDGADAIIDLTRMPRSSGLYAGPDRLGIIPIETAGNYRMEFRPLFPAESTRPELSLRHVTEQFEEPKLETVRLSGEPLTTVLSLTPGLLVVTPGQPGMLDIRSVGDSGQAQPRSALPEPRFLRARVVQPELPVMFRVLPGGDVGTSLRLDLRAYGNGEPLAAGPAVSAGYRLLAADGKTVDEGVLEAPVEPSMIDRVTDTQPVPDVSDPASFFLRLPPDAVRIVVASQQRLLVNGYTRPDDLPHRTRVPQDYYTWRGDDPGQPGWFILHPVEADTQARPDIQQDVESDRVLHIQSRPPERDPELLAGRYQWEAFDPQPAARGARILVPLTGEERLRATGLPSYFQPLEQGTQTVRIEAPGVARKLEPQLVYLREESTPFSLRLQIGGEAVSRELIGRRGYISLPELSPGSYRLALGANTAATWLMNYRYPDSSGYLRRLAFRLDTAPLRYPVIKRGDGQLVGARFYSLGEAGATSSVRVRITPAALESGPAREWTHLERIYEVMPPAGQAGVGYVLDQQRERLAPGQSMLINLGADVPDGPVTVEFALQGGAPGYVVFHEVRLGEHKRARSFREEDE